MNNTALRSSEQDSLFSGSISRQLFRKDRDSVDQWDSLFAMELLLFWEVEVVAELAGAFSPENMGFLLTICRCLVARGPAKKRFSYQVVIMLGIPLFSLCLNLVMEWKERGSSRTPKISSTFKIRIERVTFQEFCILIFSYFAFLF